MTEKLDEAIRKSIQRRRAHLGISQLTFSDKVGLTGSKWHYIEKGEKGLTLQRLIFAAQALDVSTSTLIYDAECFLSTGEFPALPGRAKSPPLTSSEEKSYASTLDKLRRRNTTWCSALAPELCETHEG